MSKILTQEEMDALLNHINQNNNGSVNPSETPYVKYDFKKKRSIIVDFTDLEFYANKFADDIKSILSTFFMKNIKVKLTTTKSMMLKELKESLCFPSGIGYCRLKQKDTNFLLVIDDTTAFAFIELFFGGLSISEKKIEGRAFTIIEQRVIKKILKEIVTTLKDKFLEFFKSEGEFLNLEMVPKHINIYEDKERLSIFEMEISMDDFGGSMFFLEDIAGKMYMIFPQSIFISEEEKTKDVNQCKDNCKVNEKLLNIISDIYFNVKTELGKIDLTLKDILNLKVEDVLLLDKRLNDELNVYLEDKLKFKGIHGILKGFHAVKITQKL